MKISSKTKLSTIIIDSSILSIIDRMGIKLGFGDATIAEVCKKYGLSTNLFLTICNIYMFDNFVPTIDNLQKQDITQILLYLRKSHEYWTKVCFPQLHANIHIVADSCNEINKKLLNKFFDDYDIELKKHLDNEELKIFPYIESVVSGKPANSEYSSIKHFAKNHSDINEKLTDLKNIVMKYLPEDNYCYEQNIVLNYIFMIEKDLSRHTLIENEILIPLVYEIEKHDKSKKI